MVNVNRNASAWTVAARRVGLNADFMHQDKKNMYRGLDELGLPRSPDYKLRPEEIDSEKVRKIFEKVPWCFARLIPRNGGIRPYRLRLKSVDELQQFCSEYDLRKYTLQIVEGGNITHTGSIISQDQSSGNPGSCITELIEGSGEDLFHGLKTPTSAVINIPNTNWFRTIRYDQGSNPTDEERRLIWRAVKLIGGPKHPFPGYYEFDVYDRKEIWFRNYQKPSTAYAKL